ncbi:MAG: 3-deoxy-7-phosphoheptulonate synthase [Planctomycetes bacterium]|nr:3-deoxy-7-phosphoheptulonate synthase [Planctomycetota bacterium]
MPVNLLAICFDDDAPARSVRDALALLGFGGPDPRWRLHGERLLTVQCPEPLHAEQQQRLRRVPGVRAVHDRSRPASPSPTALVQVGPATFGDGGVPIIAGPCSVESEAQLLATAELVADAGADALRGGAFKPRSSPYAFGGLGAAGLRLLARARDRTGLPIVTEVLDTTHLAIVAEHADMLQIGSRNMHNSPLLFAAGADPHGRPVLLKRGFAATIEELLLAAEYVQLGRLAAGHNGPGVVLCERGVRGFDPATRFQLDVAAVPVVHGRCPLPIAIDPSHAAGHHELVPALAAAAVAVGADGLLVEVHHEPERAWSDGEQTLGPATFRALVQHVRVLVGVRQVSPLATTTAIVNGSQP